MKTIWSHVCLNKKQILCLCIFVMLSAIAQMLLPSLLAEMINRGVADTNVSQIGIYLFNPPKPLCFQGKSAF